MNHACQSLTRWAARNLGILLLTLPCSCDDNRCTCPDGPREDVRLTDNATLDTLQSAGYTIASVWIKGSTIHLRTVTSGGCAEHFYDLYVSTDYMESYPVQTRAYLVHISKDPCRMIIRHTREFDLTPLLDDYRAAYMREDPIIIHIYANSRQEGEPLTVRYEP
jgi:hypothetical protein